MTDHLLQTKLYRPPLRPNFVPRPHLIDILNQSLELGHILTLISAPAGFGKTTLVSEWVSELRVDAAGERGSGTKIAWLSLDEGDNDPVRFLTYLAAVLNRAGGEKAAVGQGALNMLQSPQPQPAEAVLTSLINDLATVSQRIILTLDDYHHIDAAPVDEALAFLLEHLPPQLHVVVVTRHDPQLPLARLRARGQLTEMRAADLRFTIAEAAEFLNKAMGLELSAADVALLETRTEGWIAGLQLAAISMQGRENATSLIQSFTGSHRYVLDYLMEEVLEQQSADVQSFLLQTAVLNRLSGSLCDALTGKQNGQATLEMLENGNLFIIPLDEERRWYRYHHLFADLLRQHLKQNQLERVPGLHQRASEWFRKNGVANEAIRHALHADDLERAARLIEEQADASWQQGQHVNLRHWLMKLPVEMVYRRPHLGIFHAWYLFAGGQQDAARRSLEAAEQVLESGSNGNHDAVRQELSVFGDAWGVNLHGRIAAVRTFMDSFRGNVPGIIQHARLALELLSQQDSSWRGITAIVLGDAFGFQGDMAAAYQARFAAWEACRKEGDIYYVLLAGVKLAITLREQGRLQQTIELCREQRQLAYENGLSQSSMVGLLLLTESEALVEFNELEEAMQHANLGRKLTERAVDMALVGWGYTCLLRILFSMGDFAGAEEIIRKMESIAREFSVPPWILGQMAAWQVRVWLAQNKLDAASNWIAERGLYAGEKSTSLPEMDYFSLIDHLVVARILIAQGRLEASARLLERLLETAEAGGRTARVVEIKMLQAKTCQVEGETEQALLLLKEALVHAEPEGFIQVFVDEGPPLAQLLAEALARGMAPDYVGRLLAAFPSAEHGIKTPVPSPAPAATLIEPLSERELEVLALVAEGYTNREIGERLYLSLNTVKVHTRNIYGKLDAHNRTQAVARARSLGILSPV